MSPNSHELDSIEHKSKLKKKLINQEDSDANISIEEEFKDPGILPQNPKSSKRKIFCLIFTVLLFSSPFILFQLSPSFRTKFAQLGEEIRQMHGHPSGFAILFGLGSAMLLCCLPSMYFEIIIGYALQDFLKSFIVAMTYRTFAMALIYILSRTLLNHRVHKMADDSHHFFAMRYLARLKPWKTLFMIRFSYIPPGLINYGLPILGYSMSEYLFAGVLGAAFFVVTNTSLGLAARNLQELESMTPTGGPEWARKLPLLTSLTGFIVIFFLARYIKKRIKAIIDRYHIDHLKVKVDDPNLSYGALEGL